MAISLKTALTAAVVGGAALLGGCATGYYDDGYGYGYDRYGYGYGGGYASSYYGGYPGYYTGPSVGLGITYVDRDYDRRRWRDRDHRRDRRDRGDRDWRGDRDRVQQGDPQPRGWAHDPALNSPG